MRNQPAYPQQIEKHSLPKSSRGLTKYEFAVIETLKGILSNGDMMRHITMNYDDDLILSRPCELSGQIADLTIKQLSKE